MLCRPIRHITWVSNFQSIIVIVLCWFRSNTSLRMSTNISHPSWHRITYKLYDWIVGYDWIWVSGTWAKKSRNSDCCWISWILCLMRSDILLSYWPQDYCLYNQSVDQPVDSQHNQVWTTMTAVFTIDCAIIKPTSAFYVNPLSRLFECFDRMFSCEAI